MLIKPFGKSEENSKLTLFNILFCMFCILRLLYGVFSAPELFHRRSSEVLGGKEWEKIYIDDLLIWYKDKGTWYVA